MLFLVSCVLGSKFQSIIWTLQIWAHPSSNLRWRWVEGFASLQNGSPCTNASIFDFMTMTFHLTGECYHSEWLSKMYDMHCDEGHHWILGCHAVHWFACPSGKGTIIIAFEQGHQGNNHRLYRSYVSWQLYQTAELFKPLGFIPEGATVRVPLGVIESKVYIACLYRWVGIAMSKMNVIIPWVPCPLIVINWANYGETNSLFSFLHSQTETNQS